jgi:hypothetical protein
MDRSCWSWRTSADFDEAWNEIFVLVSDFENAVTHHLATLLFGLSSTCEPMSRAHSLRRVPRFCSFTEGPHCRKRSNERIYGRDTYGVEKHLSTASILLEMRGTLQIAKRFDLTSENWPISLACGVPYGSLYCGLFTPFSCRFARFS